MDADPLPDSEVPLATLWPPEPTFRDRLKAWGFLIAGLLVGGSVCFLVLLLLAPLIFPKPPYVAVIGSSPRIGALIGAAMLGLILGQLALQLNLFRRFRQPRDRLIFERMLRRKTSREEAEQFADRYGRADRITSFVSIFLLYLVGLYGWLVASTMYVGADYQTIGWRGFSLIEHQRPVSDVAAIYRTSIYRERTKESRPCLVVHFTDGTVIKTDELHPSHEEVDLLEARLSLACQKPVIQVPWLQQVPRPR